jgi:CheY-like chemotaxis protein
MTRQEGQLLPQSVLQNQEQIIQAVGKARDLVAQIRTFARFDAQQDQAPILVPDEAVPESPVPPAGARILFVDDEEILVALGKGVLEHLGYEVVAVQSPGEALNLVRSAPDRFDLLVTDHVMPKMTGAELVREIASIRPGLPAIVCSGTLSAAVEAGTCIPAIRRFVSKPFSINELDRTITEVLESVRPVRAPQANLPERH